MKIVIDIGHCPDTYDKKGSKGCILNGNKIEEYNLNKLISVDLFNILKDQGHEVFYSLPLNTKEPDILSNRYNNINKINPDLSVSIHHDYGKSKGFTIYTYKNNTTTKKIKDRITTNLKTLLKECALNYNGYSICYPEHQNFALVAKPKCDAMLIECGFFNNQDDVNLTLNKHYEIAKLISKGILGDKYINKEVKKVKETPTVKEIRKNCLDYPDKMEKAIETVIKLTKDNSDMGDLEPLKYLDEYTIKVFDYGRNFDK